MPQSSRLETQAGFLCYNFEADLHLWATSVFPLKAFTELVEAHSPGGGLTCFTDLSLLI